MTDMTDRAACWLPPYEGNDMISYILDQGVRMPESHDRILSMTNMRDTAVIITDRKIWMAKPASQTGFCLVCVAYF